MCDPVRHSIEEIRAIKQRYETELMRNPNTVGVGIGLIDLDEPEGEERVGIIITVRESIQLDTFPSSLDGVPVQIKVIGSIKAQVEK